MLTGKDHICSGRTCMFCRITANFEGAQLNKSFMDHQVIERVKELEQRTRLTSTETRLTAAHGEEVERLALMDILTELYNSRTFLKEIKDEVKRARRYKRPISLCMLTVDGFKDISRQYGALTSDAVLKIIGQVIKSSIRDVDIPARYTSDEFAVILPETNASGASIVAERIRQRIGNQSIAYNIHQLKVTASVGLATFPTHAKECEELLARSTQALELASERGGDCVCVV
jgi:two-component system, cell cycle response regulator